MQIFLLITLPFFFYILTKILFLIAYRSYTQRYLVKNKYKDFFIYLITPTSPKTSFKDKYLKLYFYLSTALGLVWGIVFVFWVSNSLYIFDLNFLLTIIYFVGITIFIGFLLYLSIYDIISFSIPELVTKRMLIFGLAFNIFFLIINLLTSDFDIQYLIKIINLGSFWNLIGCIIGGLAIWIIVKISKEKAMGKGDIDILAAIGLMLGFPSIIYSFYYTLITASILSLIYILIVKKYKGVLIPFVPFLASGFILTLLFKDIIIRLFTII